MKTEADSELPLSRLDAIVQQLHALGRPVTRESYLAFACPGQAPDTLPAEREFALPVELRLRDSDSREDMPLPNHIALEQR